MSFTYEDKHPDSLYVDKIWHTHTTSDGVFTAGLDGNWDIIISRVDGKARVTVNGIGKHAVQVPYVAGIDSVGIALKPGVFLRDIKGKDIVDSQRTLSKGDIAYVDIGGRSFKIPDFDSAEVFVDELISNDILLVNSVVSSLSNDHVNGVSDRSLRRHTMGTTGLSPYFFHQIQRAQHATQLLQQGTPIAQVAIEAGYTDQAHMTKAVKALMGLTPAQIVARSKQ
ncbi:MAG TPA: helix-turn-helix domain-containing protein [Candidatus Saccharimonadales bacterium]|nr:helix-turn-helix domain-containing protein [Candidatus Saccharimonadales bacterium]